MVASNPLAELLMQSRRLWPVLVVAWLLFSGPRILAVTFEAALDECDRPLPSALASPHWYFNATGGNRGLLNETAVAYRWDGPSAYTATITTATGTTYGGIWYSLVGLNYDHRTLDFSNVFGPHVQAPWQGRVTHFELRVTNLQSATSNTQLRLKFEIKDADGNWVHSPWTYDSILGTSYPRTFSLDVRPYALGGVKEAVWVLDRAVVGDSITVDWARLICDAPASATASNGEQPFLWTYAWLMANCDAASGMAQDRSNALTGDVENVTATGKAAKLAWYAYRKGITSRADAEAIVTRIADTLTSALPRGPAGVNALWPHFTRNGGRALAPGTEWASGDTVYAALDVLAALQMFGDPRGQIPEVEAFLRAIDWPALLLPNGGISMGYENNGQRIAFGWTPFGMESIGVNWAYAAATGRVATMDAPPTFNGAGFIENAQYPMVFGGLDRWGNDWAAYRSQAAARQIGWYTPQRNAFLASLGLFGLSSAEAPEGDAYHAYGTGGITGADDGGGEVIVPHYAAMIADVRPADAVRAWETLRDRRLMTPLNHVESLRVNRTTGAQTVNYLKGSWNLALECEGWAMMDARVRDDLRAAVQANAFLRQGYHILTGRTPVRSARWSNLE
jgi:hypothetical protein